MYKQKVGLVLVVFSLFFAVLFSACSAETEGDYAQAVAENEALAAQYEALLAENENLQNQLQASEAVSASAEAGSDEPMLDLYAGGEFVATVWGFVPEYGFVPENQIPVILSEFQSSLFIAYMDADMSEQLETGASYVFEVPEVYVGSVPESEAQALYANGSGSESATALSAGTMLYIESFREMDANEGGLDSPQLMYSLNA